MESNYYYISPAEYEEAERVYGLNKNTVYQRAYKNGWSKKRALTTPSKPKVPRECVEAAAKIGVSRQNLDNRLRRGWSMEKAITTPAKGKPGGKRKYEDWIYEKAKENNLNFSTVRWRIDVLKWDKLRACTEPVNEIGKYDRTELKKYYNTCF